MTVTGHGLKDIDTALSRASADLVDTVVDADVDAAAAAAGLHLMARFVDGPVQVSVPATRANLGPGFDALGLALDLRDEVDGRGGRGRPRRSRSHGEGADAVPRDESHLVVRAMRGRLRRTWAPSRPALRLHLPQRHPARPRPRLVVGGDRGRHLRWPAGWSPAARC